jgi:hypothetical protein
MKYFILTYLTFAITSFEVVGYRIQDNPNVEILLLNKRMPDTLSFSIKLLANQRAGLQVPSVNNLIVGYEDDDSADCFFQVYEYSANHWKKEQPTADYQTFNIRKKLTNLEKGNEITYKFNLASYYSFRFNTRYRIRVVFKISKYNPGRDVYSKWVFI